MKLVRQSILIIFMLIFLNTVYARIDFDVFQQDTYNLGEKILISGLVFREDTTRGILDLSLKCETGESKIVSVLIDVNNGGTQKFSQLVLIPKNVLGKCILRGDLSDEKQILETNVLDAFTVTNELKASFDIIKQQLQLGDVLNLKGNVNNNGGSNVDGIVVIYFKSNNVINFLDSVDLRNGLFEYTRDMSFVPPEKYLIDIEVSDNLGNTKYFTDVYQLDVSGNILISGGFSSLNYDPGSNVELRGFVTGIYNNILDDVNLEFEFDNEIINQVLKQSQSFTVFHSTAKNIKSGEHSVKVKAKSQDGNYGFVEFNFTIKPLATKLNLNADSNNYIPGKEISFSVELLDQASDKMDGSVNVFLINDNKIIISTVVNDKGKFILPSMAKPGKWILRAEGLGLKDEDQIIVEEYEKLDAEIKNGKLFLENKGNVKYNKDLVLIAGDLSKRKKIKLNPGDSDEFSLSGLFPSGTYDLNVLDEKFEDVNIPESGLFSGFDKLTGNAIKNFEDSDRKVGIGLLLLVVVGSLIFIFVKRGRRDHFSEFSGKKYEARRNNDFEEGRRMAENLRRRGIRKDKPVNYPEYGKANQDDIEDFKARMKNMVADDVDNKPKGGFMNMFG